MLIRSTGLGKAELVAEVTEIKRQGSYLIMEMQSSEPVRWRIRGGLSHGDLRTLIKATLKFSVLRFFLDPSSWFKREAHPGDF
jgi:hypothetical protein